MPDAIRRVAHQHLREPREVKIRSATSTVVATTQSYCQTHSGQKLEALTRTLEVEDDFDAALIFVRTKIATMELAERLDARGYSCAAISGDVPQKMREKTIDQLKEGKLEYKGRTDTEAQMLPVGEIMTFLKKKFR